jgi:hypothetical protein
MFPNWQSYQLPMDHTMMAYKGAGTDVLFGVIMEADATAHTRIAHTRLHFLTAK